jgi:hypothetical protein
MANIGCLIGTSGSVASIAFIQARRWYKGATKSGNKLYFQPAEDDATPLPEGWAERSRRRGLGRGVADPFIGMVRGLHPNRFDDRVAYGVSLRANEVRSGNCSEMSSVALSFAARLTRADAPLWFVGLERPADHAFMMVGTVPPVPEGSPGPVVSDLTHMTAGTTNHIDGLYVVDVWAGICCHASEYASRFSQQMHEWSGQGKRVSFHDAWVNPSAAGYLSVHLGAPMLLQSCSAS